MNEFQSKQIIVNNHLVNYYSSIVSNSDYNIIFIHGWLSNSKVWFHLMHALNKIGLSSYALDLPGFGGSQIPNISVDNNFYARTVEEFINKLNLKNVILVGHSNGGAIAVKLQVQSNVCKKMILIDSAGIRRMTFSKITKNTLAKVLKPVFKLPLLKNLRKKIYTAMGAEDYINSEYLQKTYNNVISEDISGLYKYIEIPTLIIWGNQDKATPVSYAHFINENIKNSELKLIDAGHFPFVDKPDSVINYLINFIK